MHMYVMPTERKPRKIFKLQNKINKDFSSIQAYVAWLSNQYSPTLDYAKLLTCVIWLPLFSVYIEQLSVVFARFTV